MDGTSHNSYSFHRERKNANKDTKGNNKGTDICIKCP